MSAVPKKKLNFRQFLTLHKNDPTPLGDLARDALDDPDFKSSYRSLKKSMEDKCVSYHVMCVLEEAKETYKTET